MSLVPLSEDNDSWTTWCLWLSTDPDLTPERIIRVLLLRWWVEPLFVDSSTCAVWLRSGNRPDRPLRSSFLVILSHGWRSSGSVLWSGGRQGPLPQTLSDETTGYSRVDGQSTGHPFSPSQGAGLLGPKDTEHQVPSRVPGASLREFSLIDGCWLGFHGFPSFGGVAVED